MKQRRLWSTLLDPTIVASFVLLAAVVIAIVGVLSTARDLQRSFDEQATIQRAQLSLDELFKLQLDEETDVRGYLNVSEPEFLAPYHAAVARFPKVEADLETALREAEMPSELRTLALFRRYHEAWQHDVAEALIASNGRVNRARIETEGKFLVDQERDAIDAMQDALGRRSSQLGAETRAGIVRSLITRSSWIVIFAVLAIVSNGVRMRLRSELRRERTITETLQRAFISRPDELPGCLMGTRYVSASRNAAVGGDLFDVHRLPEGRAIIMIADVSGKGTEAAVLTAFVKYTIRAIAPYYPDPGEMLAEFNATFMRSVPDPETFVSMFLGSLDFATQTLAFANAGHGSAFFRRGGEVRRFPATGPVIGLGKDVFATERVSLSTHDMLVLASDGLTEARDRHGALLDDVGAMALIADGSPDPQQLADQLIAAVARRSGRINDDLAILVMAMRNPRLLREWAP